MINQAVLFSKPVHHLGIDLNAEQLDQRIQDYFGAQGFAMVRHRQVSGPELAEHHIIRRHYQLYSEASYGRIAVSGEGKSAFAEQFGREWDAEAEGGRIMGNPELLKSRGIDAHRLFDLWNNAEVKKVQTGLLMAWLDALDSFCINAFYPAMEANFYHPLTRMDYYVVEFDPESASWLCFRKELLGATNASKAAPESFRGQLYAQYPVDFPGRDNFVHGSAGPFEGMIERSIHVPDFEMSSNPVGAYLLERGISREQLERWKSAQPLGALGELFDSTEEKDTGDVLGILNRIDFSAA